MSNPLIFGIATCLVLVVVVFFVFLGCKQRSNSAKKWFLFLVGLVILVSVAIYAGTGHFNDWQNQKIDDTKDYRLAAKITEARRAALAKPKSIEQKKELAQLYMEGGLFDQAADTLQDALDIKGQDAELLGLKARAAYYRDGRKMNPEIEDILDKALALNQYEVQSRMLIAEDAFRAGNYQKAIQQWQLLLDAQVAPERHRAFENAIRNAKNRMEGKAVK